MRREILHHKAINPDILEVSRSYSHNPEAILEILADIHNQRGEINTNDMEDIARAIKIPAEKAYGVATFYSMLQTPPRTIRVCDGPACWLKGAAYVNSALAAEYSSGTRGEATWNIDRSSCLGLCDRAPAALIGEEQSGPIDMEHVSQIREGWRGSAPSYKKPINGEIRNLLEHTQEIDPDDIESAIEFGAYQALNKALTESRERIIEEVEKSGLRGRGGAGFPAGRKWRFVAEAQADKKYIICNADESEPLTFKDRVMIDSNPHKIIEGMLLAAYAVDAQEGFIYIRGEYESQTKRLENAIQQAKQKGLLGDNIQESDFSFHIHLHRGAGAYICGEETALIESLEGKRGEPRVRPPYPASYGYHGMPTVVNNVETLASIPGIVLNGVDWYLSRGDPSTPGTKLYTIVGHIERPGLFEAGYGMTLRQMIEEFGGGMSPNSKFSFAVTGGAAGTIVSDQYLDIPIDYSSTANGISLGSGAFLICDETVSPLVMLRELMYFFEVESCGKCTPCRIGTPQARIILERMIAGKKSNGGRASLLNLASLLRETSFCGLGQSVAMPIQSTLKNFEHLFI
jgi:NADH:ubiquinone oxidoreductase subunit F (NADH-binding)/NADH:ubiquinone oxidoreductase subunit E